MLLYFIGIIVTIIVTAVFYVWWTFFRVPANLRGLPAIPGFLTPYNERRRRVREIAKTHEFARAWQFKWHLVVLRPELAKIVETNATLYEKPRNRIPNHSFSAQFIGRTNVVSVQTEEWKKHRAVINPAFDFAYIRAFTTTFSEVADRMISEIKKQYPSGSPVPVHNWLQRYTLDCLGITSFSYDFNSIKDPDNPFAQTYHRIFDSTSENQGIFYKYRLVAPWALYDLLPTKANSQLQKDVNAWNQLLDRMVKMSESASDSDVGALLVKANSPGAPNYLTMDEIRSNLTILFIAGHETSATSLATCLWYLARYPEVQQKAYDEVVRVSGEQEDPTFEAQKEYNYLTNVIYESNRLTPPVKSLPPRVVMHDTELGGIKLKKGDLVSVYFEALHMLETEWPNPDEFDPSRFDSSAHRSTFSWQPFSLGPRACLGRNFSMLEQRVALARILQAFKLELSPNAPDKIEVTDMGLLMKLENDVVLRHRQ